MRSGLSAHHDHETSSRMSRVPRPTFGRKALDLVVAPIRTRHAFIEPLSPITIGHDVDFACEPADARVDLLKVAPDRRRRGIRLGTQMPSYRAPHTQTRTARLLRNPVPHQQICAMAYSLRVQWLSTNAMPTVTLSRDKSGHSPALIGQR